MRSRYKVRWSTSEINFLLDNVDTMTNAELSSILGRSENAIHLIMGRRNIKRTQASVSNMIGRGTPHGEESSFWKGGLKEAQRRYYKSCQDDFYYVERSRARTAVNNAIKDGRLIKQPCVICGEIVYIQGHHEDYSKPLDVMWLCLKHHRRLHAGQLKFAV